ncbi:rRNA-processing protein UTP21 [Aspergillus tanneri]|uniref:Small-subunit processome Utp21 domain-containing protein n=1 Tax=Aspergillus tanneri TaxID=1220188 RepID=A0A5M9MQA3_9EURO|nr:uncharacterized protein ATNIH1004_005130 [Aspergillus tanneri]KAA8649235.1 hypothetical protein ATNIH1004_005130 [Aspergillus tanneri]
MPSLHNSGFDLPLAKRQKRKADEGPQRVAETAGSKIFSPYRTLGLVSPTIVPFTCVRLGKATFQITTCVGRSLQTYDLRKGLNLVFVSRPQTPEIITATFAWQDKVFAAWGDVRPGSSRGVWVFKRGKKIASLGVPPVAFEPIDRLLVFWFMDCRLQQKMHTEEIYTREMCTMPTYLNKIFVGRHDGLVDIWNVKTGKLIYSIVPASMEAGGVTSLEPSTVLSLIAVAYKNGGLYIYNIETGQVFMSLRTNSSKMPQITSIAFRSDGIGAGDDGQKPGVMATTCIDSGDITMWDFNGGSRVTGTLRSAHLVSQNEAGSGINHIKFLAGQPVLVSSGKDNALRTWVFDHSTFSPIPRPLHSRRGHSAAITTLDFLPSLSDGSEFRGKWLLSASKDRSLWGFSVRKDSQNTEISQGSVERKANKRAGASLVTNRAHIIAQEDFKASEVTCIACSLNRDGGIGVTTSGSVWANPKSKNTEASNRTGWESIVTGHRGDRYARTWFWGKKKAGRWIFETSDGTDVKSVAITQCGTFALVGSAGGSIDMFNMQSGAYRQSFPTAEIKGNNSVRPGALVALKDCSKHTKSVTGLWVDGLNQTVISCSLDGKVKFWDFRSGVLLNELNWHPLTSITGLRYSSASDLAAFSCDDLSIRVVDIQMKKVVHMAIPTASGEHGTEPIEAVFRAEHERAESAGPILCTEQLSQEMMTLSVVPRNKWQALINLDLIKERNKPNTPPKASQKAPFFLPTISATSDSKADVDLELLVDITAAERSQIAKMQQSKRADIANSRFTALLQNGHASGDFEPFVDYLKSLSPAKADLEIRSLDPMISNGRSELSDFIHALSSRLHQRKDFELVNAWMAVVLKVHADIIAKCSISCDLGKKNVLKESLLAWSNMQQREAQRLAQLVGYCRGVVGFLRSSR